MKIENIIIITLVGLLTISVSINLMYSNKVQQQALYEANLINEINSEFLILSDSIEAVNKIKDSLLQVKAKIEIKYKTIYEKIDSMVFPEIIAMLDTIMNDTIYIITIDSVEYALMTLDNTKSCSKAFVQVNDCKENLYIQTTLYEHSEAINEMQNNFIDKQGIENGVLRNKNAALTNEVVKVKRQRNTVGVIGVIGWLVALVR